MESEEALMKSLEQYEAQLVQVKQAINSTSSITDKQDLYTLEKDVEEVILLTKETLSSLKKQAFNDSTTSSELPTDSFSHEYALFKAELAELEQSSDNTDTQADENSGAIDVSKQLQEELEALKGSKCQAPYKQHWGDESYHNALIMDLETKESVEDLNHIQVRVMFVNPTEREMLPCPYYLDGECKYTEEKCHFSHGELIPLSDIREYKEPDFGLIKEGSQVLAKQKDSLWHRAKVKDILGKSRCTVKFESKGCDTVELDLHNLLPLNSEDRSESSSESEQDDTSDYVMPQEYFVQLSLLRNPPNTALGAWEKHTKGIGSRLMANMGYVVGCGLGKHGEGRLEPVEAMAYPPGKSLDACMALREEAGEGQDLFKAELRQKKQQRRLLRQQQRQNAKLQHSSPDVFSFINSKLTGSVAEKPKDSTKMKTLASSSRKGLNVERFCLGENMKKTQRDIDKLKQSLNRHNKDSIAYNTINSKLLEAQTELNNLEKSDMLIAKEQNQRDGCKKISVF